MISPAWNRWIAKSWPWLFRGQFVVVPSELGHPEPAGFRSPALSESVGQIADWIVPMSDGSRVHIHEMPDGHLVAHRDRFDPGRGALSAGAHLVTETRVGSALQVAGALWTAARIFAL